MKRFLSVILSLLMVMSTIAALPFTASALDESGQCGEDVFYTFDESTGTLTVSGSGDMYNYSWGKDSPFCDNTEIEHVVIGDGIINVAFAFKGCSNLKTVKLPDSLGWYSYNKSIYAATFYGCSCLEEIVLPNGIINIDAYMFQDCTSLKEITIPSGVIKIDSMAFLGCTSLEKIDLPDSLTYLYEFAFEDCTSLTEIDIPDSVTSCGSPFRGCTNLRRVKLSASITEISSEFFSDCINLTDVEMPEAATTIEQSAFYNCKSLKNLYIPKNVTKIEDYAFYGCSALETIRVDSENAVYDSRNSCNAIVESQTNTLIIGCKNTVVPNGITSIGYGAFYICTGLTSIALPDTVTNIGPYSFASCENLTSIDVPQGVVEIGNCAFNGMGTNDKSSYVTIPKSVTKIGSYALNGPEYVFYEGSEEKFNSIFETGEYDSGAIACFNCNFDNLDEAGIKGECGESLTYTIRVLPETMVIEGTGPMDDFDFGIAQQYSDRVKDLIISDGVTTIGANAFGGYTNLAGNITIPASVNKIGIGAFYNYYGSNISGITILNPTCTLEYDYPAWNESTIPETAVIYGYDNSTAQKYAENYNRAFVSLGDYCETNGHNFKDGYCSFCGKKDPDYVLPTVTAPSTQTVRVEANKPYMATFTPTANGTLTFYSEGDDDTYGYLYDSNMNELSANDDGGTNNNFEITYNVKKGVTYVLACRFWDEEKEGNINFTVEFEAEPHEHSYNSVVTPPTCTAKGYTTHTCECGDSFVDTYVDALGHKSDKGTVTKKATYTATGVKTYKCVRCGEVLKTETIAKLPKKANTLVAKGKTATVKFANLKKKNQTVTQKNAFVVSKAQGKVTYKKASGNGKITVNSAGKFTVKKGLKKGTYKVKVKVTAAGNTIYKAVTKTVTVTIKVK